MIYPLRIKGKEYPLSKGDIVVCITEHFSEFTFGKKYKLYSDVDIGMIGVGQVVWVIHHQWEFI
jgi:hypothetical protein